MTSSEGFQHHFTIISKFVWCGLCDMEKNVLAFTLISFFVPVQIPVQLIRLNQNVNELEFELVSIRM